VAERCIRSQRTFDVGGDLALQPAVTHRKLDKALDEATAKRWTVVDMKRDWKVIYPFQR